MKQADGDWAKSTYGTGRLSSLALPRLCFPHGLVSQEINLLFIALLKTMCARARRARCSMALPMNLLRPWSRMETSARWL